MIKLRTTHSFIPNKLFSQNTYMNNIHWIYSARILYGLDNNYLRKFRRSFRLIFPVFIPLCDSGVSWRDVLILVENPWVGFFCRIESVLFQVVFVLLLFDGIVCHVDLVDRIFWHWNLKHCEWICWRGDLGLLLDFLFIYQRILAQFSQVLVPQTMSSLFIGGACSHLGAPQSRPVVHQPAGYLPPIGHCASVHK